MIVSGRGMVYSLACRAQWLAMGCMAALLVLAFTACEHKDLEPWPVEVPTRALVRVTVDWSQFTEDDDITGMTVRAYNQHTGAVTQVITNTTNHADLPLEPGFYTLLVFGMTESEYVSLAFKDMDRIADASICATQFTSRWYTRADDDEDEMIAMEPAYFGRAVEYDVRITQEMLELSPYYTRVRTRQALNDEDAIIVADLKPMNIIPALDVTVSIENFEYLRSARGCIRHMAGCEKIATARGGMSHVTMMLERWNLLETFSVNSVGVIHASTRCFGLPADRTGAPDDNILYLELLLADGSTVLKYELPVGDKMHESNDPDNPLHIDITIPLPEQLPDIDITNAGMGVSVGGWPNIITDIVL